MTPQRGDIVEVTGGYFTPGLGVTPIKGKVAEEPQCGVVWLVRAGGCMHGPFRVEHVTVVTR